MDYDYIECGDCLELMKHLPDDCIDLTVTSPPYDNLRTYKGFSWDFEGIAKELFRITKKGGVVVWIVGDGTIKGSETGTSFKQALFFKDIGFNINDTMIWEKTNPMPQVKQPRYCQTFEFMFVFSKGKPKTFNPIMVPCKSAGHLYRSTAKKITSDKERQYKEMTINNKKVDANIWRIAVAQNKTDHPAVFPEQIASDHIISWSNKGDVVFDPFLGSGTTAKMAVLHNRHYIGFELSEEYFDIACKRLDEVEVVH